MNALVEMHAGAVAYQSSSHSRATVVLKLRLVPYFKLLKLKQHALMFSKEITYIVFTSYNLPIFDALCD